MITENSILTGAAGSTYRMGQQIGVGGEGIVYAVQGTRLVAKIYKNVDPQIEGKLRYMVNHPIPQVVDQSGNPILNAAWPQDLLYDGRRNFVGYVMPRIESGTEIFQIQRGCTAPKVKAKFPNYSWRMNVLVARNLAASVNILHKQGYVLGDMNCKNFLVNTDGSISLLDTDSIDMTDPTTGRHYKCCVGMEDYLPPELQGRNLRSENARYTMQTDDFALAVHIFQLLMNNYHPFSGKQTVVKSSSSACGRMQQIVEGKCPFLRKYSDLTIPVGAPRLEQTLPDYMIRCFRETFDYNSATAVSSAARRTTAEQWTNALRQLLQECDSPGGLIRCQRDADHYYLRSVGSCGRCRAMGINPEEKPQTQPKPQPAPKKMSGLQAVLFLLTLGVVGSLLFSQLSEMVFQPEPRPAVKILVPESVSELVDQGPGESYQFQDGSRMDLYFEGDLERCRTIRRGDGSAEYVSVAEYNRNGDIVKHMLYDGAGTLLRTDMYVYMQDGSRASHRTYRGGEANENLAEVTYYTYLPDGRDQEVETLARDGSVIFKGVSEYRADGTEEYSYTELTGSSGQILYDPQGNVLSHISRDPLGQITYWTEYRYDADGRETGGTIYNDDGSVQTSWTVRYDSAGRKDGKDRYDAENNWTESTHILYGPRDMEIGDWSESVYGNTHRFEYIESIIGVPLRGTGVYESEYTEGKSTSITRYDEMGNYIEYAYYNEEGRLNSQSIYTVDQYGYDTGHTYRYYPGDGTVSVTVYDADGNVLSEKDYDAQGKEIGEGG